MTLIGIALLGFLLLAVINRPRRQRLPDYSRQYHMRLRAQQRQAKHGQPAARPKPLPPVRLGYS